MTIDMAPGSAVISHRCERVAGPDCPLACFIQAINLLGGDIDKAFDLLPAEVLRYLVMSNEYDPEMVQQRLWAEEPPQEQPVQVPLWTELPTSAAPEQLPKLMKVSLRQKDRMSLRCIKHYQRAPGCGFIFFQEH